MGDTTKDGTLYKLYLPDEIAICIERMNTDKNSQAISANLEREQDFYNVKENRLKVFERDNYICYKCGKQLTQFSATLDHIQPVSEGGDNSLGNLITSCMHCNSKRRATPIGDFVTE